MDGPSALLESAAAALRSGEWHAARDTYRSALEVGTCGEALFGLGVASWWLGDTGESLRSWERAYVAFEQRSDHAQAVLAAFYLCLCYRMSLGNDVAANGWLERASNLVEEFELGPLEGWVLLARAYSADDSEHPSLAAELARRAVDSARAFEDADLLLCATCELGAALLAVGDGDEGASLIDQAMAGALAGEGGDLDTVVLVSCRTITACSRAADIKRAIQWISAADDFHRRFGSTHLYTTCRTHHGAVLFAAGAWAQADEQLQLALQNSGAADAALRAHAAAKLAELRIAQGRLEEAEELLSGLEDHPATTVARARLHLAAGQPTVAASIARRRLPELTELPVDRSTLIDLLAEAGVAYDAADAVSPDDAAGVVSAYIRRAAGRNVAGSPASAVPELEASLSLFGALGMPYESARTRAVLARALAGDDRDTAISEARVAFASFEQLGAARDADDAAALLRSLGTKPARRGAGAHSKLTARESEILALLGEGLSNPAMAARLFISRRTVEHHVASVLGKLGLTGRAEAAAYATRHAARGSVAK